MPISCAYCRVKHEDAEKGMHSEAKLFRVMSTSGRLFGIDIDNEEVPISQTSKMYFCTPLCWMRSCTYKPTVNLEKEEYKKWYTANSTELMYKSHCQLVREMIEAVSDDEDDDGGN